MTVMVTAILTHPFVFTLSLSSGHLSNTILHLSILQYSMVLVTSYPFLFSLTFVFFLLRYLFSLSYEINLPSSFNFVLSTPLFFQLIHLRQIDTVLFGCSFLLYFGFFFLPFPFSFPSYTSLSLLFHRSRLSASS